MGFLGSTAENIATFLVVLTVLVFVHELGHYLVARWNGVRIETFSIGFGPELFGWFDRRGTRWRFSAILVGGYVKMFGDADAASMPGEELPAMTAEERAVSFHHKPLPARAAVIAAGPAANFLFTIVVLTALFATYGQPYTPPEVGVVPPDSPAAAAGIQPHDVIVSIDGQRVNRFEDVQDDLQLNTGTPIPIVVRRNGADLTLSATPKLVTRTDRFGNSQDYATLDIENYTAPEVGQVNPGSAAAAAGIQPGDVFASVNGTEVGTFGDLQHVVRQDTDASPLTLEIKRGNQVLTVSVAPKVSEVADEAGVKHSIGLLGVSPRPTYIQRPITRAVVEAGGETWSMTTGILRAVGQMIRGTRNTDEIGGPLRIVQMSGQVVQGGGLLGLLVFMAGLSVNLGLINLFPIPVLDGGHLLFYAAEALRGRPLGQRAQEFGFRVGLAIVLTLMVFATWNDLAQFHLWPFTKV
jgi:regulator of sigma E protease